LKVSGAAKPAAEKAERASDEGEFLHGFSPEGWGLLLFGGRAALATRRNLICISLATVPKSAHMPSPIA
jgi:hypothetical protein